MGYFPKGRTVGAIGTAIVLVISSLWIILFELGIKLY